MADDPTRPDDEQPDVTANQSEGANEATAQGTSDFVAPHPGSKEMPQWNTAELIDAPYFTRRNWFAMLGPALVMGGAAIGVLVSLLVVMLLRWMKPLPDLLLRLARLLYMA